MQTFIFEEHRSVLPHWFGLGYRDRTVICFDAHLDLQAISQPRIERLVRCETRRQVDDLGKQHHLLPDGESSYSIEDFFFAASRLGIIGHLVWVAPPHVQIENSDAAIAQLRELDGVTEDCLDGFVRIRSGELGVSRGVLLGVPLTVCRLESLTNLDLPDDCLVDIDIDYFVHLCPDESPRDQLGVSPRQVVDVVRSSGVSFEEVTISRSVDSGFTPLRFRFLAEFTDCLLRDEVDEAKHYESILAAYDAMVEGRVDEAAALLDELCQERPCCAAAQFALESAHLAQASSGKPAIPLAGIAAAIDPCYSDNFLRDACQYPARQVPITPREIQDLELRLDPGEQDSATGSDPQQDALIQSAIGLLWCHVGDLGAARRCFIHGHELGVASRELALEIGKAFFERDQLESAAWYMNVALDDDKTKTAATFFLAVIALRCGEMEQATRLASEAHQRAPAWAMPIELLAHLGIAKM